MERVNAMNIYWSNVKLMSMVMLGQVRHAWAAAFKDGA